MPWEVPLEKAKRPKKKKEKNALQVSTWNFGILRVYLRDKYLSMYIYIH